MAPNCLKERKKPNEMQLKNRDKTMRRMLMTCCFDCKVNSTKARVSPSSHSPTSVHDTQCSRLGRWKRTLPESQVIFTEHGGNATVGGVVIKRLWGGLHR